MKDKSKNENKNDTEQTYPALQLCINPVTEQSHRNTYPVQKPRCHANACHSIPPNAAAMKKPTPCIASD
jgi:hypothetical protein